MSRLSCQFLHFKSIMSTIHSCQFLHFKSVMSSHWFQSVHVNSFMPFLHINSFMWIPSFLIRSWNSFISIQFIDFKSCVIHVHSCIQFLDFNSFMFIPLFQLLYFNSFQRPGLLATLFSLFFALESCLLSFFLVSSPRFLARLFFYLLACFVCSVPLFRAFLSSPLFSNALPLLSAGVGGYTHHRRKFLEVKLPTIWRDGKAEVGRVKEEKIRDGEDQRGRKSEERRCRCAKR